MTKRAREYQEKALAIPTEIGNRDAEAAGYESLGTVSNNSVNMTRLENIRRKHSPSE